MNAAHRGHVAVCGHDPGQPVSGEALAAALASARARASERGVRWTPLRERALELVLQANGPVKAYDLVARFRAGASTAPPTVYRALDTLVELGLVHRIPSLNAYTACHALGAPHVASFLICDCCGGVEEIVVPSALLRAAVADHKRFSAQTVTLEAHGRCDRCQA